MADLLEELTQLVWLEPWAPVTPAAADQHAQWLARLPAEHALRLGAARPIAARSDDVGDVLFVVGQPARLSVVNLRDPNTLNDFASVEEFSEAVMEPDHLEHSDEDV